ncbi:MAG: hypothetical protein ABSG00_09150 [Terracidiphilus sp.]|jgi:hypothetical protein
MQEQKELVFQRMYSKAGQTQTLIVRKLSGGDISGAIYQLETWLNNVENVDNPVKSGDKYFVRTAYVTKLQDLKEDGWSKQVSGGPYNEDAKFFDPELL